MQSVRNVCIGIVQNWIIFVENVTNINIFKSTEFSSKF